MVDIATVKAWTNHVHPHYGYPVDNFGLREFIIYDLEIKKGHAHGTVNDVVSDIPYRQIYKNKSYTPFPKSELRAKLEAV